MYFKFFQTAQLPQKIRCPAKDDCFRVSQANKKERRPRLSLPILTY